MKLFFCLVLGCLIHDIVAQCVDVRAGNMYVLTDISIAGSTNVSTFSFRYKNQEMVNGSLNPDDCFWEPQADAFYFRIPVNSFQASLPAMLKDFLEMLHGNSYPYIIVGVERDIFESLSEGMTSPRLTLLMTLAGVRKTVHTDSFTVIDTDDKVMINGVTRLNLSDFLLEPPEKALGLIQVKDEVFVTFDLEIYQTGHVLNQANN